MLRLLLAISCAVISLTILLFGAAQARGNQGPIGMHAMLFSDTPFSAKEEMFRQAQEVGASFIRVDLPLSSVFTQDGRDPWVLASEDWSTADQYAQLGQKYQIKPLAVVYGVPHWIAACPPSDPLSTFCPTNDLAGYSQMMFALAERYRGLIDHFQIMNEPDSKTYFSGTPEQYGQMLAAGADAIHSANPEAQVVFGGLHNTESSKFTDVMIKANPELKNKVDINTIHLRVSAYRAAKVTATWFNYWHDHGFHGPLWITEFGYPADPRYQYDPQFKQGEKSQADYLKVALPWIVGGGAKKIFVTQRDWGKDAFASEGILQSSDPLGESPIIRRRPAFSVIRQASGGIQGALPVGASLYYQEEKTVIYSRNNKIELPFLCPIAQYCPSRTIYLRLRGLPRQRLRVPTANNGRQLSVKVKLSRATRKSLNRRSRLSGYLINQQNGRLGRLIIAKQPAAN